MTDIDSKTTSLADLRLLVPIVCSLIFAFAFRFPAAMDIPNHIARAHILNACLEQQQSALCDNFSVHFKPISYFFPDYTLMLLLRVVSAPYLAANFAIALVALINLVGWHTLFKRVHGTANAAYIGGLILLFNNFLYKGFYAYLLGNGALLLWLAYWWPRRNDRTTGSAIRLGAGLFLLFLCHLAAFFTAVFCYCLYAVYAILSSPPATRPQAVAQYTRTWPFFLCFCLLYGIQQFETGATILQQVGAQGWDPSQGIGAWIELKVARFSYVFVNHEKYVDLAFFVAVVGLAACGAGYAFCRNILRNFWGLAFAALCTVYLIAPDISHGGSDVDLRFLLPAYYCLFLWLGGEQRTATHRPKLLATVVFLWFCFNLYFRFGMEGELTKLARAVDQIPAGQTLVEINSQTNYPAGTRSRVNPFSHFAMFYYLDGGVLVEGLLNCYMNPNIPYFCYRDKTRATQNFKNQFEGLPALSQAEISALHSAYGYFLVVEPREALVRERLTSDRFEEVFHDQNVYLFKRVGE